MVKFMKQTVYAIILHIYYILIYNKLIKNNSDPVDLFATFLYYYVLS